MRQTLTGIALLAAVAGCVGTFTITKGPPSISTSGQLLKAMHDRYESTWYRSLTFVQKSTYYRPDGSILRTETWYEAAALPGRLRIDLGDPARGNGVLYRRDSTYQLQGGRVNQVRYETNPLLTLGFDVYTQPTYNTDNQLKLHNIISYGIHEDTLDGRPAYVAGALQGNLTTNQFWVDKERLLFVRLILTEAGRTRDIRFGRYTQYEGGWVAEDVRVLVDGRMSFHEEYSQVRVNVPLDNALFLPQSWSSAPHWYRP